MTTCEKSVLRDMRQAGRSYGQIAEKLGVSKNTIKSICRREGLVPATAAGSCCLHCHAPLPNQKAGCKRAFCSDACRYAWHNAHRALQTHKVVSKRCACCGNTFLSYPSGKRKYCSRACYIADRYHKESHYDP